MQKEEVLQIILGLKKEQGRKSTLQMALNKARWLLDYKGREKYTSPMWSFRGTDNLAQNEIGDVTMKNAKNEEEDIMTVLCLYLIALDQLGHIFGKKSNKSNRVNDAIKLANKIENLNIDDDEITSIKNLRNSINHNFGLACISTNGKAVEKFTIEFDNVQKEEPIESHKVDGNWSDKSKQASTKVCPFAFINFAEKVYQIYVDSFQANKIESPLSTDELKTRFTVLHN